MRRWAVALACVMVAACGRSGSPHYVVQEDAATRVNVLAPPLVGAQASKGARSVKVGPAEPMLAYSYEYGIEAPAARLPALLKAEQQVCEAAGTERCQIVGASTDAAGRDQITAKLEIRAEPTWLRRFRDGLDADAHRFGGRLTQASTTSEDLTRQIVDTDAALRAKTLLRDRLQQLLKTHPGKLSDLVELEQAMATNQGEIDATQSELAVMRARVMTSTLTVQYHSEGAAVEDSTFAPLGRALTGALGTLVKGLAALIWTAAFLLPFALLLWLFVWSAVRMRWGRRSSSRRTEAETAGR